MNAPCKGFIIVPLLLILIAIFFIGGGSYAYLQTKPDTQPTTANSDVQATSQQLPIAATILSDTHSPTDYEKSLVNRMILEYSSENSYKIKYYDDKTVAFNLSTAKSVGLSIHDITSLKRLGGLYDMDGAIESSSYIISANGSDLVFYKKGGVDLLTIPGSTLSSSETYATKWLGMISYAYDFAFDEPTKTLTASVFRFKPNPDVNAPNIKLRTVKFVLP